MSTQHAPQLPAGPRAAPAPWSTGAGGFEAAPAVTGVFAGGSAAVVVSDGAPGVLPRALRRRPPTRTCRAHARITA
ncbi:hypothetical protein [Streptosporangium roseum]|uniref:hypothetical protein n=1 Tax=Streptosporangium roseum TaxID=2001 RepID=UPI00331B2095